MARIERGGGLELAPGLVELPLPQIEDPQGVVGVGHAGVELQGAPGRLP